MRGFSSWFGVIVVSVLLIAVPLGWWPRDPYGLVKWTMVGVAAVAVAVVWLASSIARGRVDVRRNAVNLPLLLLIAWSALSLLIGPHRYYVMRRLSEIVFLGLIYFILVCTIGEKRRRAFLVVASMIGLSVISILGIAHYAGFFPDASPWGSGLGRRVYATMLNPNFLAAYIISLFPLSLSFFVIGKRRSWTLVALLAVLVSASLCLLFTVSWGGWLGWLVAAVLLLLLAAGRARRHLVRGRLIAVVVLCALLAGTFIYLNRGTVASDYSGMKFRVLYWRASLDMIGERPFIGFGLNGFWPNITGYLTRIIASDYREGVPEVGPAETVYEGVYAHNEYLGIWLEMGIIGLILFVWLMAGFFYQALRNMRADTGALETAINAGALCGVAAMLAQSLFSYPLRLPATTVSCALLMALAGSGASTRAVSFRLHVPVFLRALIALAVIACAVPLFPPLVHPLIGEGLYVEARRASFRGDWGRVDEMCRAALEYPLTEPEIYDLIGDARENLGSPRGAIGALCAKLELKPYDVNAYLKLGKLYERLGREDRAAWYFERAVRLERHDSPEGRVHLASVLAGRSRKEDAIALLEEGMPRYPRNWVLRNSLGIACADRGDWNRAAVEFIAGRECGGGAVPKYNLRVLKQLVQSDGKGAGEFIGPREYDWIRKRIERGRNALRMGDHGRAREEFESLLGAYPDYVPALSNMGIYYMKTRRMEKALELWRRATELDPEHRVDHSL